jgi:CBS domain-containing protein
MNSTPVSALLEQKGSAVFSVHSSTSIVEAVTEMNHHRVGCVLVIDEGKIVGIFTERDVLKRVVGAGINPDSMLVRDVMSRNVLTIAPQTTVEETMSIFTERRCRHLPVMKEGTLIGLISIGDISRWLSESHRTEVEHLKNYIAGGYSAAS